MKSFLKVFGILFILLFQLTSCLDNDDDRDPVYYFYDEPVIVDHMGADPVIRTQSYLFRVPELADSETVKAGDLLWTSFIFDANKSNDYSPSSLSALPIRMVTQFRYKIVSSANVIIPADAAEFESYLSDDYGAPIDLSVLYNYHIDSLWFFGFKQKVQASQLDYTYELILNPDSERGNNNNYPTLYIRSKQVDSSQKGSAKSDETIFAFNVADFVKHYKATNTTTRPIRFNLKYKTGADSKGNDIYREFMSNPISWNF